MDLVILSDVEKFIDRLEQKTQSRIFRELEFLSRAGFTIRMPYSKKIFHNLFELRISGDQNIRIFYTFANTHIYVVSRFIKKSDKLPYDEISKALGRIAQI